MASVPSIESSSTIGAQTAFGSIDGHGAVLYRLQLPSDAPADIVVTLVGVNLVAILVHQLYHIAYPIILLKYAV